MTNSARSIRAASTVAVSLLLVGTSASVHATPAGQSTGASQLRPHQGDPSRFICVKTEMPATRILSRVCRTAAEWEQEGGIPFKQ